MTAPSTTVSSTDVTPANPVSFVWLEITGKCQLECTHCYADSGPTRTHGQMGREDWEQVITDCARLGVGMVQFIGGEPTLHPNFPGLVEHALAAGLDVEVYSNLVHVPDLLWTTFQQPGVTLACSYYSDSAAQHAAITGRRTYPRTKANIAEAVRRDIPVRVGVIDLDDEQRITEAIAELATLGVTDIGTDRVRGFGRATTSPPMMSELCGQCVTDVLAVGPDGSVWPCVFSRHLPVGNVLATSLADIVAGRALTETRTAIADATTVHTMQPLCQPRNPCPPTANCAPRTGNCEPKMCSPQKCKPRQ